MFAESSKAFIFQKFAVKVYLGLSLHNFQHGSSLSLENVCDSWCMHQTGFSSAAVGPLDCEQSLIFLCKVTAREPKHASPKHLTLDNTISFQNLLIMICTQPLRLKYAITIFIYIATTLPHQLLPVGLKNISNALS